MANHFQLYALIISTLTSTVNCVHCIYVHIYVCLYRHVHITCFYKQFFKPVFVFIREISLLENWAAISIYLILLQNHFIYMLSLYCNRSSWLWPTARVKKQESPSSPWFINGAQRSWNLFATRLWTHTALATGRLSTFKTKLSWPWPITGKVMFIRATLCTSVIS